METLERLKLGAFKVIRVLGHGASSRVLEIEHDDSRYALKVSLGPDHDERLKAEATVLGRLRHPRIVRLERRRVLGPLDAAGPVYRSLP